MLRPAFVRELKRIVGSSHLSDSQEDLVAYSYDATGIESLPWAVAHPSTSREVSEIITLANKEHVPVIPRGAGTGMSGGSVPVQGGIVISFERMNGIIEIDADDLVAVVEPGVVTGDLQREVEARGLFYPPDPASSEFCTVGGNIAECAGGLRAVKYGVTKDYVLGLEVVLPTGELIETGGRTLKNVAGYDLTKLIVGSEGTLGVVTRAILKLLPLPESVMTLAAFFDNMESAAAAASGVISSRMIPRALELIDGAALRAVEGYLRENISDGAGAMLIVEADGDPRSAESEIGLAAGIAGRAGASRINISGAAAERESIWKARRAISPALYAVKPGKINEDIVVPRSRIADILREIEAIGRRYGLMIVNFGHAGDGNIHTNIMIDDDERERAGAAVKEIFEAVVRMKGSITGEHGVGVTKAEYLPMEVGMDAIETMKRIKKALDPNNILNPGKIFA